MATTRNERGHEIAKTLRPSMTVARWPSRETVTNSFDVPPIKAGANSSTDPIYVNVNVPVKPFDGFNRGAITEVAPLVGTDGEYF